MIRRPTGRSPFDWGLYGKDLFLPNRNQQGGIIAGRSYIVYLFTKTA